MTDLEAWKHADYIYACYLAVGFFVGALTLWIFRSERKQNQRLEELDQSGKS